MVFKVPIFPSFRDYISYLFVYLHISPSVSGTKVRRVFGALSWRPSRTPRWRRRCGTRTGTPGGWGDLPPPRPSTSDVTRHMCMPTFTRMTALCICAQVLMYICGHLVFPLVLNVSRHMCKSYLVIRGNGVHVNKTSRANILEN